MGQSIGLAFAQFRRLKSAGALAEFLRARLHCARVECRLAACWNMRTCLQQFVSPVPQAAPAAVRPIVHAIAACTRNRNACMQARRLPPPIPIRYILIPARCYGTCDATSRPCSPPLGKMEEDSSVLQYAMTSMTVLFGIIQGHGITIGTTMSYIPYFLY